MAGHSLLAPSSGDRWINCTPSVRATEHVEEGEPEDWTLEGTLLHDLAKLYLLAWRDSGGLPPDYELATLRSHRLWSQGLEDAALEYVEQVKLAYVRAVSIDPSAQLRVERRVSLEQRLPEPGAGGTVDAAIVYGTTLEVRDAKGGVGKFVSAVGNAQIRLYALALLDDLGEYWPITDIELYIHQPRLDSVTHEHLTRRQLEEWAKDVVAPAARKAWAGIGEFVPGDWCQFCKIRKSCAARAEKHMAEAKVVFSRIEADPLATAAEMTVDQVAEFLPKIPALRSFLNDLESYALQQAKNGVEVPGYKLVHGRSIRRITDAHAAATALLAAGAPEALVYERVLLPLTTLEKSLGKKTVGEAIGQYLEKPAGRPTLVPDTDGREPIDRTAEAVKVFSEKGLSE